MKWETVKISNESKGSTIPYASVGRVVFARMPNTTHSASSIAMAAREYTFFNSFEEFTSDLTGDIVSPFKRKSGHKPAHISE